MKHINFKLHTMIPLLAHQDIPPPSHAFLITIDIDDVITIDGDNIIVLE